MRSDLECSVRDIFALFSSISMLFSTRSTELSSRDCTVRTLRSLLQVRDLNKPEDSRRPLSNAVPIDTTFVFETDSCNTNVHDCSLLDSS
jgi:hypothetical protein